jgi:hypothetical protein
MMYLPNIPGFILKSAIVPSLPYIPHSGEDEHHLFISGLLVDKLGKRFMYTILLIGKSEEHKSGFVENQTALAKVH